jgi:hypothetical protein
MRCYLRLVVFGLLASVAAGCTAGQPAATPAPPPLSDADFTARVNAFVDEWHEDAAHARPAFFDKIASDGIYIGTDKTERWAREAFREWAKPAFARPVAWAFTPLHRNVRFSPDRTFIWFDEQVRSSMGNPAGHRRDAAGSRSLRDRALPALDRRAQRGHSASHRHDQSARVEVTLEVPRRCPSGGGAPPAALPGGWMGARHVFRELQPPWFVKPRVVDQEVSMSLRYTRR